MEEVVEYQSDKLYILSRDMFKRLLIILLPLLAGIIFQNPSKLGFQDWDQHYAFAGVNNISLFEYKQLPLWNPYHCGGMSQIGNPQNLFLTPFYLTVLIFGPVIGYKLQYLLYLIIGLSGLYKLGKYYCLSKLTAIFISVVYAYSGLFFGPYASGMPVFFPLLLLPYLFLFLLKSLESKYNHLPALNTGIIASLIFLGGYHYILEVFLFVFAVIFFKILTDKKFYPIRQFLIILFTFLLLSSVKLLPSWEFSLKNPRIAVEEFSGFGFLTLFHGLINPFQNFESYNLSGPDNQGFIKGKSYQLDENSLYIGILPVIFFIIGILKKRKMHFSLLAIFILFLWLSFGYNIYPGLYKLLQQLPLFNLLRVAQRYRFFFMISLAIFAGFGFEEVRKWFSNLFPKKEIIIYTISSGIILFIGLDLLLVNNRLIKESFEIKLPQIAKTFEFKQRCGLGFYDKNGLLSNKISLHSSYSDEYPYILNGWGTINCYEPQPVKISASCIGEKSYRGENYLLNSSGILHLKYWSPNKLIINTQTSKKDFLIVNQNYDPGWKATNNGKSVSVLDKNGLLAVSLAPGMNKTVLYYLSDSFVLGLIISLTATGIIILYIKKLKPAQPK